MTSFSDAELRNYHLNAYEFIWFAKKNDTGQSETLVLNKNITSESQQKINQNPVP